MIQVGAFVIEKNAHKLKEKLLKFTTHPVDIFFEDRLFKVQAGEFKGIEEAYKHLHNIIKRRFPEAFIARNP